MYEGRIVLSAIKTLDLDSYEEVPIGSIELRGVPAVSRTHTYSFDGSLEALDDYRRTFRCPSLTRHPR